MTRLNRSCVGLVPPVGGTTLLATALLLGWVATLAWATTARGEDAEAASSDLSARGPDAVEAWQPAPAGGDLVEVRGVEPG